MEQVRAKQSAPGFLKEHTCIPPMRDMRGRIKPEAKPPGFDNFVARHRAWRPYGEIVQIHLYVDEAADGLCLRRLCEPIVQRAAFIALKMTEADVAEPRGIDQALNGLIHLREHSSIACVEQQRDL